MFEISEGKKYKKMVLHSISFLKSDDILFWIKKWKNNVLFVFLKIIFLVLNESEKKSVLSRIKKVLLKNAVFENDQKKEDFFFQKMFIWIKDDRDSVTRWKICKKKKRFGLDRCFPFCRSSSKFLLCIPW